MRGDGRIFQRGRVWWIAYYAPDAGGKFVQVRESSESESERIARKLLAFRVRSVANHRNQVRALTAPKNECLTVGQLLDALRADYEQRGIKSLRRTLGHMRPVRDWFGDARAVSLGPEEVQRYITARRKEVSGATVNREMAILASAYRLALKGRRIVIPPPYAPKLKEGPPRGGFFEAAEHELMLAHLPEPLGDMARLAYVCGWRRGEVRTLRWEYVDRAAREVRLPDSKNGRGRVLPLDGELWAMFERLWAGRAYSANVRTIAHFTSTLSEFVFHRRGRPVSHSYFSRLWARARAAAGPAVAGRIFHDYRRTAVRNLIRAGVPQSVAMSITGHVSDSIFRRYNITSTVDRVEALAKQRAYLAGEGGNVAELHAKGARTGTGRRKGARK